jgi:hypothetical protein
MLTPRTLSLVRVASALAVVLVFAGCTPGGQFDPTELLSSDMFNTKKKVQGEREPLFPNGVPGAETGVPQDLVKGYQPPPELTADNGDAAAKAAEAQAKPEPKPKLKPKPKPKVATAPPPRHDPAWDQKPAPAASRGTQSGQSVWPAPQTAPGQQTAQPGQSVWPNPPQSGSGQQNAQSGQSVWPNPPPPGTNSH